MLFNTIPIGDHAWAPPLDFIVSESIETSTINLFKLKVLEILMSLFALKL